MNSEQYEQIRRGYLRARELDAKARSTYLQNIRSQDEAVANGIDALLSEETQASSFLEEPLLGEGVLNEESSIRLRADGMPEYIGKYKVNRIIGRGGMGIVYQGQQVRPPRPVAIKVIRPDVISSDVIKRFEHEGHVLSMLNHEGIAKFYDIGTFDLGVGDQPFFVMEYIEGVALFKYAEQHQLSITKRLDLIQKLCDAVQHAHHRGIVHRDLKPSNILVTDYGQPKVVDFGIARLTDSDIKSTTMHTQTGQVMGTVAYMSPEQCDPDPYALDTRSDVYSLGVIAYELLTGEKPYECGESVFQAVHAICEKRPTPMRTFNAFLNEDLVRIINRTLEKDKATRIQSAADFRSEIDRFLAGEPLAVAAPESRWYQARMLAHKHRASVATLGFTFMALLVLGIGAVWMIGNQQQRISDLQQQMDRQHQYTAIVEKIAAVQESPSPDPTAVAALLSEIDQSRLLSDQQRSTLRSRLAVAAQEQERSAQDSSPNS